MPEKTIKPIPLLYRDSDFFVFNKPPGLLTIPAPNNHKATLTNLVNTQYLSSQEGKGRLYPCHRLDRDTSGVIIYAKGKNNQKQLMEQFRQKRVKKEYIAVVKGHIKCKKGKIALPVMSLDKMHGKRRVAKGAITYFEVLKSKPHFSIVMVKPLTGRTNQIRIHFAKIGHPILGDRKYGIGRLFPVNFPRTALHAAKVQFCHPKTGRLIEIEAPLPEDMQKLIGRLHCLKPRQCPQTTVR